MSEAKRYHVSDTGLAEGIALGRITVVLVADHESAIAREAALQQRLTVADQRVDDLEAALKRVLHNAEGQMEIIAARAPGKFLDKAPIVSVLRQYKRIATDSLALQSSPATKDACSTCGGTKLVDDGELTCSSGGFPYENGPIQCVKDCPDCVPATETCKFPQSCTITCGCKPEPSVDYIHTPGSGNKARRRIAALSVDQDIDPFKVCLECFGTGSICTGIMEASNTICNACDGVGREPS